MACVESSADTLALQGVVSGRYRLLETLGRGGMGAVYRALDLERHAEVALKTLDPRAAAADPGLAQLLRREFGTLMHIRHPHIIEVYDYGVAEGMPFYTMELLTGEDVGTLAPVPWAHACSLLRDVASSLAILHSRRLIHRDVSAHNVRRARSGRAKLLDFGAMCPMGRAQELVGTPPFVAPEVLSYEPLDARTDLYALGALGYFMVTGRHAYPAHRLEHLFELWQERLIDPSALAPGLPPAMAQLLLSLLGTDPRTRPGSAGEVIDRLTALAGLECEEPIAVSQAYLTTPELVARADALADFGRDLSRAEGGTGAAIVLTGEPGMGRSRLLSRFVLEGKMAGALVLFADGGAAAAQELGLVPALRKQLPDEVSLQDSGVQASSERLAEHVREALFTLARSRTVVVAVDDLHRCDRRSIGWIGALAQRAGGHRLVVVASAGAANESVHEVLERATSHARRVKLLPLGLGEVRALIHSVFGEGPRADAVAEWTFEVSVGNPAACLELCQHLVDERTAVYSAGVWHLPDSLRDRSLPSSLAQAVAARILHLGDQARELGGALATAGEWPLPSVEHWGSLLSEPVSADELLELVSELRHARVLVAEGGEYRCAASAREVIRASMTATATEVAHVRLAAVYAASNRRLLQAHHLQLAGRSSEALSVLVGRLRDGGYQRDERHRLLQLEAHCHEAALRYAQASRRARAERDALKRVLLSMAHHYDPRFTRYGEEFLAELWRDAGLDDFDPRTGEQGLRERLERASERYAVASEADRGLRPLDATLEILACAARLSAVYTATLELDALRNLNRLDVLRVLSPVHALLCDTLQASLEIVCGRNTVISRALLVDRLRANELGLDPVFTNNAACLISLSVAWSLVLEGYSSAERFIGYLEQHPHFVAMAWQARTGLRLSEGDAPGSQASRKQAEFEMLRGPFPHPLVCHGLVYETAMLALIGDVSALKQLHPRLEARAAAWDGWRPVLTWAKGEYHRLLDDLDGAFAAFELAGELSPPGAHWAFVHVAPARVRARIELGRHTEAIRLADDLLAACAAHDLSPLCAFRLRLLRALALAQTRELAVAREDLADIVGDEQAAGRTHGLPLGLVTEIAAEIALLEHDTAAAAETATRVRALCWERQHPALLARYGQLIDALDCIVTTTARPPATASEQPPAGVEPLERCRQGLELLVAHSGAAGGLLYGMCDTRPRLLHVYGCDLPTSQIDAEVAAYVSRELASDVDGDTERHDDLRLQAPCIGGDLRHEPFLLQVVAGDGFRVVGVALLSGRDDRGSIGWAHRLRALAESVRCANEIAATAG